MPFTLLSHRAPVLPLKFAWPRIACGQALVIGSMAPDFQYFLSGRTGWAIGHTVPGQFLFCLPISLIVTWLVSRIIAEPLSRRLPDAGAFHLRDYYVLSKSTHRTGYWIRAIPCALIGSFSHIAWDSFTHSSGYMARHLGYANVTVGALNGHSQVLCKALQHGSSLVGAMITLYLLFQIGRDRLLLKWVKVNIDCLPERPNTGKYRFWATPALCAAAIVAFDVWTSAGSLQVPGLVRVSLHAVASAFAGLCLCCL